MKTTVKKLPDCQIEIEVELSPEEFNHSVDDALLKLGESLQVKGFRKGKVPPEIVKKEFSQEKIINEAANLAIGENYRKALLENNVEAISHPQVEIVKLALGNSFVFRAKTTILPEVFLPDYKKIAGEAKRNKIQVNEKDIEAALDWLRKSRTKLSLKNGPAEKGDFVEIEYQSSQLDGLGPQPVKDGFILGDGHLLPGFEEGLTGMKTGDEKEISVVMPENHFKKELAGKKINLKVKVKAVQKAELPEVNDEFAKNVGTFKDLADLKNNIKDGLTFEKEQAESQRLRAEILDRIVLAMKFEIPGALIAQEKSRIMEEAKHNVAEHLKIQFSEYLAKINKSEKELFDSFAKEAENRIKRFLVLREIGKREEIQVSEHEIEEESDKILRKFSSAKEAEKELDPERLKMYTEEAIRNEKIFSLLENSVK